MLIAWLQEVLLVAVLLVLAYVMGSFTGHMLPAFGMIGLLYLLWHIFQLLKFHRWVTDNTASTQPCAIGAWCISINAVREFQKRNVEETTRLLRLLDTVESSIDALPDATLVIDHEDIIQWMNQAAVHLLGFERDVAIGTSIFELLESSEAHDYLGKADYLAPLKLTSPVSSNILLELHVIPFGDSRHLLQFHDISRLEQLETVRQDFVANVSHEMRTPLTVVRGYLETMREDDSDALEPWLPILAKVDSQAHRLQSIVDDLLLLSRLEKDDGRESETVVDVAAELDAVVEEARILSGERAHDIILQADRALRLRGRQPELRSLFSNLVFNAVIYTPPRGEIRIDWSINEDGGALFSVTDTGIGIEQKHIPRLTERFYRVDTGRSRKSGGTGLGLAIVRHVINRHDGRLEIDSRYGEGSSFKCYFPARRIA